MGVEFDEVKCEKSETVVERSVKKSLLQRLGYASPDLCPKGLVEPRTLKADIETIPTVESVDAVFAFCQGIPKEAMKNLCRRIRESTTVKGLIMVMHIADYFPGTR